MSAQCPVCGAEQTEGLLCHSCTSILERELGDVPAIVAELDVTISKQARLLLSAQGGALARERDPMNTGAVIAADHLNAILTGWARDVSGDEWRPMQTETQTTEAAAWLLDEVTEIRKHPAVKDLVEEIHEALYRAERAYDRPANKAIIYVGPCPEQAVDGSDCPGDVFAFFPVEDHKPPKMECGDSDVHKWDSIQWYRVGKRILDRSEKHRRAGAA